MFIGWPYQSRPVRRIPEMPARDAESVGRPISEFAQPRSASPVSAAASAGSAIISVPPSVVSDGDRRMAVAEDPAHSEIYALLGKFQDDFQQQCAIYQKHNELPLGALKETSSQILAHTTQLVDQRLAPVYKQFESQESEIAYFRSELELQRTKLDRLEKLCTTPSSVAPAAGTSEAFTRTPDPTLLKLNCWVNVTFGAIKTSLSDYLKDYGPEEYRL